MGSIAIQFLPSLQLFSTRLAKATPRLLHVWIVTSIKLLDILSHPSTDFNGDPDRLNHHHYRFRRRHHYRSLYDNHIMIIVVNNGFYQAALYDLNIYIQGTLYAIWFVLFLARLLMTF